MESSAGPLHGMESKNKKEFHHVIVGPGALGTALAAALARHDPVGLLGRSEWPHRVEVASEDGHCTPVRLPFARSSQALLMQLPPRRLRRFLAVWVTLPPELAVRVGLDVVQSLLRRGEKSLVVVFGNNGLVDPSSLAPLFLGLPAATNLTLLRAIFFTGFRRDWIAHTQGVRVQHTGGHRVVLGPLQVPGAQEACGSVPLSPLMMHLSSVSSLGVPSSLPSALWAPFGFEWHDDVRRIEIVKFFVNAVLAFGTGPRELSNGTLHDRVDAAWLQRWATLFSLLFPFEEGNVPADEFLATLEQTIVSAAANVNSVSLAGHRGDTETLRSFVEALPFGEELRSFSNGRLLPKALPEDLKAFLSTERERVEREWGLRTQCNP